MAPDVPAQITLCSLLSALIASQLFRRFETYRARVHLALLVGLPAAVAFYISSIPNTTYTFSYALAASLRTYLLALIFLVISYRLSPFHPLARYPGPVWQRITKIGPGVLSATTGGWYTRLTALHEKYGDVVRIGPNELSIADPSYIGKLLGVSGVNKGPNFIGATLTEKHVPLVGIQNIDLHLERRKAWNRGLSSSALKEYEPMIIARTQQLVQRLQEQHGAVILGNWINYWSYDTMADMAFGGGAELLRAGGSDTSWKMIEEGMKAGNILMHLPWLGMYIAKVSWAIRPVNRLLVRGRELVQQRLARGSTTRDLFHYLNNEDLPHMPTPPPRQLSDDGVLAMVAGSDTISSTLTNLFFCILTNPRVYKALQDEVDRFYPPGENVYDTKHHRSMHYLQAVINESLRLFPPVPSGGQRQVPHHDAPVIVGSLHLPPSTTFYMPPWTLHRDPRNFNSPTSFWPERWLVAAGQLALADAPPPDAGTRGPVPDAAFVHNDGAFVPFSHGPMNCPGKGLALLEARLVVCALVQQFRMRVGGAEGEWDQRRYESVYRDFFTATRPPVPVVLEAR